MTILSEQEGHWCEECKTICSFYDQGLSCDCAGRWETEVIEPSEYPAKWIKVTVEVHEK